MAKTRVRGITIKLDADTSGLARAISAVNAQISNTQRDLKDVEKLLQFDPGNVILLQQKFDLLRREIDNTEDRIDKTKEALLQLGKRAESLENLQEPTEQEAKELENVSRQMEALERQIIDDTRTLEELTREFEQFGYISKQQALAVADSMVNLGKKISSAGDKLMDVGKSMTTKISTPIYTAGKSAVGAAMDFEDALGKVQAISLDATAEEMAAVEEAAKNLAAETKFSAEEVAQAVYYESLAGWDLTKSVATLPHLLDLAAAGNLDLGRASDIVTDYMTAFNMEIEDAGRFVDVMAATMANSNTDVDQLGEAFKYVAPVAGSVGYAIEDVSIALGMMASQGIKGSQAGTSLRMIMQRLTSGTRGAAEAMETLGISIKDEYGNLKPFKETMDDLRQTFGECQMPVDELTASMQELDRQLDEGETTEEEYEEAMYRLMESAYGVEGAERAKVASQLGGVRAMSGLLAIINTTDESYRALDKAIRNSSGSAKEMADIMESTSGGQMKIFKDNLNLLAIEFGNELLPHLKEFLDFGKRLVQSFSNLSTATKRTIITIAGLVASIGPLLIAGGAITKGIGNILSGLGDLGKFFINNGQKILAFLTGPGGLVLGVGAVIAAFAALAISVKKSEEEMLNAIRTQYEMTEEQKKLVESVNEEVGAFEREQEARQEYSNAIAIEKEETKRLIDRLHELVDERGNVKAGYEGEVAYILHDLQKATGIEMQIVDGKIEKWGELVGTLDEVIAKRQLERLISSNADDYDQYKTDALNDYNKLLDVQAEKTSAFITLQQASNELEQDRLKLRELNSQKDAAVDQTLIQQLNREIQKQEKIIAAREDAVNSAKEAYDKITKAEVDQMSIIESKGKFIADYEKLVMASLTGTTEDIQREIDIWISGVERFGDVTNEELKQQAIDAERAYQDILDKHRKGEAGVTQAVVDAHKVRRDAAVAEYYKSIGLAEEMTRAEISAISNEFERGNDVLAEDVSQISDAILEELDVVDQAEKVGREIVHGQAKGMRNAAQEAISAAYSVAVSTVREFKNALAIHSPSKVMEEVGKMFDLGFAEGILGSTDKVVEAAKSMGNQAVIGAQGRFNASDMGSGSASNYNTNMGGVNITINAQPGQDENYIANLVSEKLSREVNQLRAVYV